MFGAQVRRRRSDLVVAAQEPGLFDPCALLGNQRVTVMWWMLGVAYQAIGSSRVTGIRPPHSRLNRTRQCAKLGKETKARRPIRSSSSSTLSGRCVVCSVWLRIA